MTGTVLIEISPDVTEEQLTILEENLKEIGWNPEIIRQRNVLDAILLALPYISTGIGTAKSLLDTAKTLYNFIHSKDEKKNDGDKIKLAIREKDGRKIEISNLTVEEVQQLLDEQQKSVTKKTN